MGCVRETPHIKSCLSLVTVDYYYFIYMYFFFFFFFSSQSVVLFCVFCFFVFSSVAVFHPVLVLFRVLQGSFLSSECDFLRFFPSCLSFVTVLILLLISFLWLFFTQFLFSVARQSSKHFFLGLFLRSLSTQLFFLVALLFLVLSVTAFCYADFFQGLCSGRPPAK